MKRRKKISGAWYYLLGVIIIYVIVACINIDVFLSSLSFFSNLMIRIIPIFVLVLVLMTIANLIITPKFITKHLQEPGIVKWIFAVSGGILSTGPIFMWYPLLADLKEKGIGYGCLATFLYNRAIKIPLLPVAIFYFGIKYIVALTIVMVIVSIVQGIIIDKVIPLRK